MFAVFYEEFGEASVLKAGEQPDPHAGPGQIRIAVQAAGVNPFDCARRAGEAGVEDGFPVIPGIEAAGRVDEVGAGVVGVAVGDEVFGVGTGTTAEFAVLDHWAHKPASLDWQQAAVLAVDAVTRTRLLTEDEIGARIDSSAWAALNEAAETVRTEDVVIDQGFHFTTAAEAHRRVESGQLVGRVVFGG